MKYSLQEALRELREPKKSLKESANDDVNNLSPEEVVTKYIFEPMGIEEEDCDYLEQTDDDGHIYENIVHYLSEEDWQKLFDEFSDIEGDKKLRTLLPENVDGYELEPYWELDRGTYNLDRPAVAFYTQYIGESDDDSEEYDESMSKNLNESKDNKVVEFKAFNFSPEDMEMDMTGLTLDVVDEDDYDTTYRVTGSAEDINRFLNDYAYFLGYDSIEDAQDDEDMPQLVESMWWWTHEIDQIDKAKKQMKQGVSKRQFIKNQQKDFPGFLDQPGTGLYDKPMGKNIARSEYNAAKGKGYFKKKNDNK